MATGKPSNATRLLKSCAHACREQLPATHAQAVRWLAQQVQLRLYKYDICVACDMVYRKEHRDHSHCPICASPRHAGPNHRPQMIMYQHSLLEWLRLLMSDAATARCACPCDGTLCTVSSVTLLGRVADLQSPETRSSTACPFTARCCLQAHALPTDSRAAPRHHQRRAGLPTAASAGGARAS